MARRVAVCAVAQTGFVSNMWQKRFQQMCFETVESIVKQTGVDWNEETGIRNIVTCSDDVFDARTISDNGITDAVGAHFRGEEKTAQDGINAIAYAMACIMSGHDDVVLVVGHTKESQTESRNMCSNLAFDPFYCRDLGLDFEKGAALQARAYALKSGISETQLAKAVVNARRNAAKNPLANARELVTVEQVVNSPMLCDPIRALHAYPVSDGAVAMLLAAEDKYKEYTDKPVWLTGWSNCMDSYFFGDRDLASNFSLKKASAAALKMAGVSDAKGAFDVVEINDAYAYQLAMWAEGLGLCDENKGGEWIESGILETGKINPSGGMLAGNPIMLGGLARAAEAVIQLRGEAGERQVAGAKRAVAQGTTGPAGQHQAVMILEN
ncbi:MAG TPA: thiolase family protein [bacterium]|nr:thiolase family protein [bacterium]